MWKQKQRSLMDSSAPLIILLMLLMLLQLLAVMAIARVENFTRSDFPVDFIFGAGSSAFQVEGAAREDGRTPSIWDTFVYANKGLSHGASGDIACDQYHKYKEDVQHMVDTGLEAYRFSISWSRLIPDGRGRVNPKGLEYYNNLINELLMHGIQPHVTLFHFDTPQVLEDEYGGWLSRKIVNDFTAYADVCFKEFGDRVLYWTTINEGNVFAMGGYDNGIAPPGRCSFPFGLNCSKGNSITEPYIAGHNMLLAHSSAVKLYYKKHKVVTHGIEDVTTAYFIVVLPFLTVSDVFKSFFIGIDQWFWCGQNIDHFECSEKETNTFLPTNEIPSIKPLKLDNIGCQIFQGTSHCRV